MKILLLLALFIPACGGSEGTEETAQAALKTEEKPAPQAGWTIETLDPYVQGCVNDFSANDKNTIRGSFYFCECLYLKFVIPNYSYANFIENPSEILDQLLLNADDTPTPTSQGCLDSAIESRNIGGK